MDNESGDAKLLKQVEDIFDQAIEEDKKPYFVTMKEHPVLQMVVFYLHEC